jgi:hypothetical protein
MGGKRIRKRSSVVWGPPGWQRAKRLRLNGSLDLVARAGFIPNGNGDRSHRDATLLALRVAGAGGAYVMAKCGHGAFLPLNGAYCSRHAKKNFFVLVKIAQW